MTLSKLLLELVLLVESVGGALYWVSEYEARLCEDAEFVTILQFASLVSADERIVDERAVPRQILDYCDKVAALLLREYQAMSVRDGVRVQLTICERSVSMCDRSELSAAYHTRDAGR